MTNLVTDNSENLEGIGCFAKKVMKNKDLRKKREKEERRRCITFKKELEEEKLKDERQREQLLLLRSVPLVNPTEKMKAC